MPGPKSLGKFRICVRIQGGCAWHDLVLTPISPAQLARIPSFQLACRRHSCCIGWQIVTQMSHGEYSLHAWINPLPPSRLDRYLRKGEIRRKKTPFLWPISGSLRIVIGAGVCGYRHNCIQAEKLSESSFHLFVMIVLVPA